MDVEPQINREIICALIVATKIPLCRFMASLFTLGRNSEGAVDNANPGSATGYNALKDGREALPNKL